MGGLVDPKIMIKDKAILAVVKYFLAAIFFFPVSFILWYLANRRTVSIYLLLVTLLTVSSISLASYAYVLEPLGRYHINFGIYSAIVYGGIFTVFFFLSRINYPVNLHYTWWLLYHFSYFALIMSTIFWTVIPRYYLAHKVDRGTLLLCSLGILWFIVTMCINKYCSPIEEWGTSISQRHTKMTLVMTCLIVLCTSGLLWLIICVSQRLN